MGANNKKAYLPGIDFLRGFAALGVAWFHSRIDLWVGFKVIQANPKSFSIIDRLLSWFSLPVSQMGQAFVMLFFILSGFCIHFPFASNKKKSNWRNYTFRRFFRIYPAYFFTILFCLIGSFLIYFLFGQNFPDLKIYAASIGLMQNWIYGHQTYMNISLWSIPVEVEFYIIYPFLYWLFIRYGFKVSFLFVFLCGCFSSIMFFYGIENHSGSFFKYLAVWASGAWLAEKYANNGLPKWSFWHLGTLLFVFTVTLVLSGLHDLGRLSENVSFYLFLGWGISFFLVLWWILGPGANFFVLSNWCVRFFVFLGTISYSIYLLHFPLFKFASAIWVFFFGSKPESFLIPTLAVVLVIPFSWIFYRFVELPSIEIGRRLSKELP